MNKWKDIARMPLIREAASGQTRAEDAVENGMSFRRVLIVEDNPDIRKLLCVALRNEHAELELITDGASMRRRIEEGAAPAVVVLDRLLPAISGDLLLKAIRTTPGWMHTPVIMISGLRRRTEVGQALRDGANQYLPKPLNLGLFASTVGAFLH